MTQRDRCYCPACMAPLLAVIEAGYERNEWGAFCPNSGCEMDTVSMHEAVEKPTPCPPNLHAWQEFGSELKPRAGDMRRCVRCGAGQVYDEVGHFWEPVVDQAAAG